MPGIIGINSLMFFSVEKEFHVFEKGFLIIEDYFKKFICAWSRLFFRHWGHHRNWNTTYVKAISRSSAAYISPALPAVLQTRNALGVKNL